MYWDICVPIRGEGCNQPRSTNALQQDTSRSDLSGGVNVAAAEVEAVVGIIIQTNFS